MKIQLRPVKTVVTELTRLLSITLLLSFAVFSATGCGGSGGESKKDDPVNTPKSSAHLLNSFQIMASNNTGLVQNCSATIIGNLVYLTVPEGISLTSLKPTFAISDKATLKCNGNVVESGATALNFSQALTIQVVAENGSSGTYSVLARNGILSFDNAVYNLMKIYNIPAVSLAVTKNEQVVYAAGYGYAEKETKTRADENSIFRLASVSKTFCSMCIMKLHEQGVISIYDTVFGEGGLLADEFPAESANGYGSDYADARIKNITVENLLYHNSGLTYLNGDDQIFAAWGGQYYGKTLEQRIDYMIHKQMLTYSIGSTYSYLNIGFCILGKIVEKVTGKAYEEYMRELLAEADVDDIWLSKTAKADRRANEVVYYPQNGSTGYQNDMAIVGACGAVCASAKSVVRAYCGVDYGSVVPDILQPATLDLMYAPSPNYSRYAHGWRMNHGGFTKWASYHSGNLATTASLAIRGKNGVNAAIVTSSRSYGITDANGNDIDDQLYIILGSTVMPYYGN